MVRPSRVIGAGVLATMTMDLALITAARAGPGRFATERLDPGLIGRWAIRLGHGRWHDGDVSGDPPSPPETATGLAVHYITGVTLTLFYLAALRGAGVRPGPAKAVGYGLATSALPLMVMFPSMGYGCCGRRSGEAGRLISVMAVGHAAFGAGIGLWSAVLGLTRPRG